MRHGARPRGVPTHEPRLAHPWQVHGGAIALGHPLGASGSRITMHLAHAISRGEISTAVGSACIGGGQGIALVLRKA